MTARKTIWNRTRMQIAQFPGKPEHENAAPQRGGFLIACFIVVFCTKMALWLSGWINTHPDGQRGQIGLNFVGRISVHDIP